MNTDGEARDRPPARAARRRRHRGGLPDRLAGRLRGRQPIAREVRGPVIAGLARAIPADIDRAGRRCATPPARASTPSSRTTDIHIAAQAQDHPRGDPQARGGRGPARPRPTRGRRVLAEDAGRADREFLCTRRRGRDRGRRDARSTSPTPSATRSRRSSARSSRFVREPGAEHRASASSRSTATTTSGWPSPTRSPRVQAGARQVECTINGIGERAGNACARGDRDGAQDPRRDLFGADDRHQDTSEITRTSRLVSRITGIDVQPNKAIVGRNAFAHESGIHQDGVLKDARTYEIMDARVDRALRESQLVLGKHSGRHALRETPRGAGLRAHRSRLEQRLHALQGARRQEEGGLRRGPEALVDRRVLAAMPDTYTLD